jgi:predicted nucleotide-binding protein
LKGEEIMEKTTILLADNDEESREVWAEVLRAHGYEVVEADSSSAAREKLNQGEGDLAVFDLHMDTEEEPADQSGRLLAEEARDLSVPAVILTGEPSDVVWQADQRPAVPVVDKKGGPQVLLETVRTLEDDLKSLTDDFVPVVFLAHGHDKEARDEIVEFLAKGRMQVVVLQEQGRLGETIIERFERYSQDAQLAIILVTPDDLGCKWEKNLDLRKLRRKLQPRARQNVIFELGYFTAKLGRLRVIVLSKGGKDIELPSDYAGVVPVEMGPDGDWRKLLFREMKRVLRRAREV